MNTEKFLLPSQTHIGTTELYVKDLALMKDFYSNLVGLAVIEDNSDKVFLGFNGKPLVRLFSSNSLSYASSNSAGLYHNAVLFAERSALANAVDKILEESPEYFEGTADHKVSEAFYFQDPEGNGLELYFDKDRSSWEWQDGRIVMGSEYIDPEAYIAQYKALVEQIQTSLGHVHLKIGNIQKAKDFYVHALGFEITAEMPTALFVSAGGYHHHLGMNTWQSLGASKRSESLGLKSFSIVLPSENDIEILEQRLTNLNILIQRNENMITLQDPWNNVINIST